jgi:hypothetical protein
MNQTGLKHRRRGEGTLVGYLGRQGLSNLFLTLRRMASRLQPVTRPTRTVPVGLGGRRHYRRPLPGETQPNASPQSDTGLDLVATLDRSLRRYWH